MISLRKFWNSAEKDSDPAGLLRVVQLLIQGIALHAVEGDAEDYQAFRHDVQRQLESAEKAPALEDLMLSVGSVLKALEGYNTRTTRHLRVQGAELHHMIAMLAHTVATLGSGSAKSVGKLREIEAQLEKVSAIEDVRVLKLRLAECLESIRTEAVRHKAESDHTAATLQEKIQESKSRISAAGGGPALDPTTGLPARAAANAALAQWVLEPNPPYAALFIVDRVLLINTRFGYEVGDRVLKTYLEELRKRLAPGDQIFRWSGPAFLALLNRPDRIDKVREHLRFALPAKIERNFELANRSVLLSLSATWALFALAAPLQGLTEQLDAFLASHYEATRD